MKNLIFKICSLTLVVCLIAIGCYKTDDIASNDKQSNLRTENPGEGEDDVCEIEEIDTIVLNVPVIDGVLSFQNHEALMTGIETLSKHGYKDILEWQRVNGFISLYSEFRRIGEIPNSQRQTELNTGRLADLLESRVTRVGDTIIDLVNYDVCLSKVLNQDGLVRVGNYIGALGDGLSIWTSPTNKSALIEILNSRQLPENASNFIVLDPTYFQAGRTVANSELPEKKATERSGDYTLLDDAFPKGLWSIADEHYNNDGWERRIFAKFRGSHVTTPGVEGTLNYSGTLTLYSRSEKPRKLASGWKTYRTDHYWTYDFVSSTYGSNPPPPTTWRNSGQADCTEEHSEYKRMLTYINVSQQFINDNGFLFVSITLGNNGSGLNGTGVSHRGMGNKYIRLWGW
jgi:hypothetical protein